MSNVDLKQFCADFAERPELCEPFTIGRHTYATDGRLLVRVPKREGFTASGPKRAETLFDKHFTNHALGDLSVELGGITSLTDCDTCNGSGHEHDCPSCDCPCVMCGGGGKVKETTGPKYVGIGAAVYDVKYIRLVAALPVPRFASAPPTGSPGSFSFEGGEGILMPMAHTRPDVRVVVATAIPEVPTT